jgi:hypothetical protein
MPFTIRQFRRYPVYCSVTYNAGPSGPHLEIAPTTFSPLAVTA